MSRFSDSFFSTVPLLMDIDHHHPGAGDLFPDQPDDLYYIPDFDSTAIPYGLPVVEPVSSSGDGAQPPPEVPDPGVLYPDIDLAEEEEEVVDPMDEERLDWMIEMWRLFESNSGIIYEDFPLEAAPVRRRVAVEEIPVVAVGAAEMARGVNCCAVCVEDYTDGEVVSRLPCGHCFHKDCISPWFETRVTCPICRFKLA